MIYDYKRVPVTLEYEVTTLLRRISRAHERIARGKNVQEEQTRAGKLQRALDEIMKGVPR